MGNTTTNLTIRLKTDLSQYRPLETKRGLGHRLGQTGIESCADSDKRPQPLEIQGNLPETMIIAHITFVLDFDYHFS